MPISILMPALSPTMTEGTLSSWLKKEGDEIRAGEAIAEIETDKATMEVEAVEEGRLGRILIAAGTENVAVNTPIALLLEDGEDAGSLESASAPSAAAPAAAAPAASPATPAPAPAAAPVTQATRPAPQATMPVAGGTRIIASPLARRMAEGAGLDLGRIHGSGPRGRIIKADIERAMQDGSARTGAGAAAAAATAPPASATATPPATATIAPPADRTAREIPLSNMRKVIARRLSESKQQVPHFYLTADCRLDALLDLRQKLNGRERANYKLSVNDLVVKATALAIRAHPAVNAQWGGDRLFQLDEIDISVAVAIEGGLITPILRDADRKSVVDLSIEMKDLAERARAGKLAPHEFQGGGFSISNLGMYGVREFAAVINPPQACILAVGAGEKRPVVVDDGLAIATMMSVTLSVDHRVVDGALAAEWLRTFKQNIEDPLGLLI